MNGDEKKMRAPAGIDELERAADTVWRARKTPAPADVDRIYHEVQEIEHLLAVARNERGPHAKSAKRQASAQRARLTFDLESFFPVPLPDGRIVTEGRKAGNYTLIFGKKS